MKKIIKGFLLLGLMAGSAGWVTSCKDYDGDITDLQQQIDAINADVTQLQNELKDGKVITSISESSTGITITLSDGKVLNLTNGKDGKDGADGTSWTIGSDGYWYKNGEKTDYRAIGEKGEKGDKGDTGATGPQGPAGPAGETGAQGESGIYYVPESDGFFWIYKDGTKLENSGIRWMVETTGTGSQTPGITAVFSGTKLVLGNVQVGTDENGKPVYGQKEFEMGTPVGSLEFIPSVMSKVVTYPTTTDEFFFISDYFSEAEYNKTTKEFITQTDLNKSNAVDFVYRVNPSDAYVWDFAQAKFINRGVTSRAEGDHDNLLNVLTTEVKNGENTEVKYFDKTGNGEITVSATVNAQNMINGRTDIAALKLMNGQTNWTVSDYVSIEPVKISAQLVDAAYMRANAGTGVKTFYNRTKAITSATAEDDGFIKLFCNLNALPNVQMKYDQELDLNVLPGLYCSDKQQFIDEMGFTGISYKFSLPKYYKANDAQGTNQQWFVELKDGILKANSSNLTNGLTPAIGRTPVVRVDAFMLDNAGENHLMASAYIKVEITRNDPVTPGQEDKDPYIHELEVETFDYHKLSANPTQINQMLWTDVNNLIYGATGLTSNTFWDNYGGDNKEYSVKVITTKDGSTVTVGEGTAKADDPFQLTPEGIICETTLGSGSTQTSNIKFMVDNKVKTENYYDGFTVNRIEDETTTEKESETTTEGAKYEVIITIPSKYPKVRGDVMIKQVFYVYEDCPEFDFNENYYAGTVGEHKDVVITKGKDVGGVWKLQLYISEVFKMINGQNIFQYYNATNANVKGIKFSLKDPVDGVSYADVTTPNVNGLISLSKPLTSAYKFATMQYTLTLVNGETCGHEFNIQFLNPFVGTTGKAISINGNATGLQTAKAAPSVVVNDVDGKAIYLWNGTSLDLTDLGRDIYKAKVTEVKYDFDTSSKAFLDFTGNLDPKTVWGINEDTGEITYDNLGATLIPSYTFNVVVTVTFDELSEVKCLVPFTIKGRN